MKIIYYSLLIITVFSCSTTKHLLPNNKVQYKGALKNMMHHGDLTAKANLKDYKNIPHLYALGAIENLKGEVQIFDSKPFQTMKIDGEIAFDRTFDKKACLFVYASVQKWKSVPIPNSINTYEELEGFVAESAAANSINITEPFPFLIDGTPKSFDWHVINWKDGDTEHSHEKHIQSGLYGTKHNLAVNMLGFYSDAHHAIFTHHTTNMHIHFKTTDGKLAGHMDGLILGDGMVLKLPI